MDGQALSWRETIPLRDKIRSDGICQFMKILTRWHARSPDQLLWGDELEFILVEKSQEAPGAGTPKYRLFTAASSQINYLNDRSGGVAKWNHEFGSYMIEVIPVSPFKENIAWLNGGVEENMRARRKELMKTFGPNVSVLSIANFPLLGAAMTASGKNEITKSEYVDDSMINLVHPRFGSLARNIRERRKSLVNIKIPIFQDTNTTVESTIHMDAMTFGMGCCCLQLTFQSKDISSARTLFDQFVVLAPIALGLSAASPIYRGMLSGIDCRWRVVSGSVDDRTEEERDEKSSEYISKSRYASISRYLDHENLNDLPIKYNQKVLEQIECDFPAVDVGLKKHLAHLFVRDPLVVYQNLIDTNMESSTEHFDNIQSTNWQTVRFKPPTNSIDGWRVEFRPMDIQLTDRENAALSCWVCLFARIVVEKNLDFCIPITLVEENMEIVDRPNAILNELFWFKLNDKIGRYRVEDIIDHLNNIMTSYISEISDDPCPVILDYLNLISDRADGSIPTDAKFIRNFVQNHSNYKQDSIVSSTISDDLIDTILSLEAGK